MPFKNTQAGKLHVLSHILSLPISVQVSDWGKPKTEDTFGTERKYIKKWICNKIVP